MALAINHVILDRDGVLNLEAPDGGYVTNWSQWRWLPGAREGLAMLGAAGVCVSVATNQAGVGRGIVSQADLDVIHAHMTHGAALGGGVIGRVFVCPHAPDSGCDCRKPAPGLLNQAIEATGIPRQMTIAVGDDLRDVEAAWAANVSVAVVRTGKGCLTESVISGRGVPVFADLREFAAAVLSNSIPQASAVS
ncbi:MAG: HAD-IIIA family hydrolase [Rudaea sp.]